MLRTEWSTNHNVLNQKKYCTRVKHEKGVVHGDQADMHDKEFQAHFYYRRELL
jgi:hypothetical protein